MADNALFSKLKKLFSTNVVIRNVGGDKLRVMDIDSNQAYADLSTNFMKTRFPGFYSTYGRYGYNELSIISTQRPVLFRDYELMETDPIIASALDIYADECTTKDEFGAILSIKSDNDKIKKTLDNLFFDILNIEFNAWPWIRNMCKYGDHFLKIEISENYGIVNVIPLSPYELEREEGFDSMNPFIVRFKNSAIYNSGNPKTDYYENYEIAHFRLLGDANFLPYGKSMIESGRRVWKQLQLMEDAMLIHRIMRAPDKRIFKIDVGNVPAGEIDQYMKQIVNQMKKQPLVDPKTGDYNLKYNLMNMIEDYFLPVRGGDSGTSIDNLPGLTYNAIDDIEYLRNKMMAALKVPKAFLGYDEAVGGKATLAAEDVRFARTIERIQKIFVSELTKLAILHLYVQGFDDSEIVDFELSMSSPSTIYEQEMVSLWSEKVNLIRDMKEVKLLSNDWIYKKILKLSETEIEEQRERVVDDVKETFRQSQIENEGNDPYKTGQTFGTPYDIVKLQQGGKNEDRDLDLGDTNFKVDYDRNMDDSTNDPSGTHMHFYNPDDKIKSQYDQDMEERDRKSKLHTHYGQDSHVRGRDPMGRKDYVNSYEIDKVLKPKFKNNSPLSREGFEQKDKTRRMIAESLKFSQFSKTGGAPAEEIHDIINDVDDDKNTFLDENNLMEPNK